MLFGKLKVSRAVMDNSLNPYGKAVCNEKLNSGTGKE